MFTTLPKTFPGPSCFPPNTHHTIKFRQVKFCLAAATLQCWSLTRVQWVLVLELEQPSIPPPTTPWQSTAACPGLASPMVVPFIKVPTSMGGFTFLFLFLNECDKISWIIWRKSNWNKRKQTNWCFCHPVLFISKLPHLHISNLFHLWCDSSCKITSLHFFKKKKRGEWLTSVIMHHCRWLQARKDCTPWVVSLFFPPFFYSFLPISSVPVSASASSPLLPVDFFF